MGSGLKSELEAVACSTEGGRTVDEKLGPFGGVFPLSLAKKRQRIPGFRA